MLRAVSAKFIRSVNFSRIGSRSFSWTCILSSQQPNAPIELDPSYQALLKDVDLSLLRHSARHTVPDDRMPSPRELEIYPDDPGDNYMTAEELALREDGHGDKRKQKSPAGIFGTQRIGAVIIPFELQHTITRLISEADKPLLRVDAKRLFLNEESGEWDTAYDMKYKSYEQASRHGERDGTAFASVALPAHYSAIYSVLDHIKQRLGPDWNVEHIIDWGSGAGSGLWAASHAFQKSSVPESAELLLANSAIKRYIGIDKRMGLVSVAQRLLQDVKLGDLAVTWQKTYSEDDRVERVAGKNSLALSAFLISSLPTPQARRSLVREMWESGAEIIALVDHNTTAGFQRIVEAREMLLKFGQRELEDPNTVDSPVRGCHVVAPCPHDRACPLHHPGSIRLVCGFSQRMQRPSFVRKTKHSGAGHEDTEYSYVVIRRGPRPPPATTKVGRIGEVGKREIEKAFAKKLMTELVIDDRHHTDKGASLAATRRSQSASTPAEACISDTLTSEDLQAALRIEAYSWPRLVFPPLKKPGHIIIDGCTAEGKIMRMTIPKSQGKQPFYDARKSSWGDIFPHEPKNPPQERYQPKRAGDAKTMPLKGEDIGKRSAHRKKHGKISYGGLSQDLKEESRRLRKERKANLDEGNFHEI